MAHFILILLQLKSHRNTTQPSEKIIYIVFHLFMMNLDSATRYLFGTIRSICASMLCRLYYMTALSYIHCTSCLFLGPIAAVVALLKKIKLTNTNRIAPYIIVKINPTSSANQTGGVVGCHHENKLYVCVHGGFQVEVPDLVTMLGVIIQFHYILHISFPRPASSVYHFLSHVFGDKTSKSLSKTQKDILRPLA